MAETLVVHTPRLLLRPVVEEDAQATAEIVTRDVSDNLLTWPYPCSAEQVAGRVHEAQSRLNAGKAVTWAILRREDERLMGWLVVATSRGAAGKIGYWLGSQFRGQGYAREAAGCAIAIARDHLSLRVIRADVFPANKASMNVLDALHFRRCGAGRATSTRTGKDEKVYRYRLDL